MSSLAVNMTQSEIVEHLLEAAAFLGLSLSLCSPSPLYFLLWAEADPLVKLKIPLISTSLKRRGEEESDKWRMPYYRIMPLCSHICDVHLARMPGKLPWYMLNMSIWRPKENLLGVNQYNAKIIKVMEYWSRLHYSVNWYIFKKKVYSILKTYFCFLFFIMGPDG